MYRAKGITRQPWIETSCNVLTDAKQSEDTRTQSNDGQDLEE